MKFISSIWKSLYDVQWYEERWLKMSFGAVLRRYMRLFYFLVVVAFLLVTVPLMILLAEDKIRRAWQRVNNVVSTLYPDDLILQVSQASWVVSNATGPTIITLAQAQAAIWNPDEVDPDARKNFLVIDTSEDAPTLDEYDTYVLVKNSTLEVMSEEWKNDIYPIQDMLIWAGVSPTETIVVNQDVIVSTIQSAVENIIAMRRTLWWGVLLGILIFCAFIALFVWLFVAIVMFIHWTLVYLISKTIKGWLTYEQSYSMASSAYTVPFLIYLIYPSFWGRVIITGIISFFVMKRMQQKKNNTVIDVSEKTTDWNLS